MKEGLQKAYGKKIMNIIPVVDDFGDLVRLQIIFHDDSEFNVFLNRKSPFDEIESLDFNFKS